jgi:hypothetical protein
MAVRGQYGPMAAAADAGLPLCGTFWMAWAKPGLVSVLRRSRRCGVVGSAVEKGRNVAPGIRSMTGQH